MHKIFVMVSIVMFALNMFYCIALVAIETKSRRNLIQLASALAIATVWLVLAFIFLFLAL